ncbi:sigma-54-dependent Fis family transcriptional regulator [Sphingomonas sediminicola]|jgi:DNA-binding NtrC family response regulator|uniref:DNA-binding transcriptional regulator NtrC n=1 Tax=Sphingomonas sediminicola TaxID=386874 RepID=A0ABX6T583_9SPHN|nr:sigma-54 dependent transcriptional regulator [Sphingomonas sediminicola]QNP44795.1 sigma-54-dependent Fis family transcriptional regulator [Sphingomonas sediminicola]
MREQETKSLLLVEADPAERRLVSAVAARAGWSTVGADCTEMAISLLQGPHGREVQAAFLANWDEGSGPAAIAALRSSRPSLPVIVAAKGESVAQAVNAMRAGATDFLTLPVAPERLVEALAANSDRRKPAGELIPVSEKLAPALSLEQLVGSSPQYRAALAVAAKAARNRLPILIVGEPGTGKETVSRAIHAASLRARGPLVIVDCKAVPGNVVDSELFGHVKGAFPGAFAEKSGRMLEADMGTLVLDEIGALPQSTQETLDRVLATGEVRPVGCNGSSSVDIRLIATTSAPLAESFNQMLGERISVTVVNLPPLRDRSADIPNLARHLLQRFAEQELIPPLSIGNDALAVLMRYGWPGNVRQLASVLFRAGLQCDRGGLTAEDFPHIASQSRFTGRKSDFAPSLSAQSSEAAMSGVSGVTLFTNDGHLRTLEEIEADIIRLAIGHYRGRMTEVARRLGIGRSTLYRKLSDIGIDTAA